MFYKINIDAGLLFKKNIIYFSPLWLLILNFLLIEALFVPAMLTIGCDTRQILNLKVSCPTFILTALFSALTFVAFWLMILGLVIIGLIIDLFEIAGLRDGLILFILILTVYFFVVDLFFDYMKKLKYRKR